MSETALSACGRCHMIVARYAPQVVSGVTYHKECYAAWYFGIYKKQPRLRLKPGERNVYIVDTEMA